MVLAEVRYCGLKNRSKTVHDEGPVVLAGEFDGGLLVVAPTLRVADQQNDCVGKRRGGIGENEVAATLNRQSLRTDRSRNYSLSHGQRLENLEPRASSDP